MEHIAVMDKGTINKILDGTKTIESRFSKNKITPYNKVSIGDTIYLKETGKDIKAKFIVEEVMYFSGLTSFDMENIREKYGVSINANIEYWESKKDAKYGTLMYINSPNIVSSFKVNKKGRSGFITIK